MADSKAGIRSLVPLTIVKDVPSSSSSFLCLNGAELGQADSTTCARIPTTMSVRVRCTLKLGGLVKFCFDTFGNTLPLANYEQHLFNIFINPRFFVAGVLRSVDLWKKRLREISRFFVAPRREFAPAVWRVSHTLLSRNTSTSVDGSVKAFKIP